MTPMDVLILLPALILCAWIIWAGGQDRGLELTGIVFFLLLIGALTECRAKGKPLDIDSMDISVTRFGCNREPMTPQYECRDYVGRVAADFNLRLFDVGYWDNQVHTEGLKSQVKTVGWQWELGLRVAPYLDVFYAHHSRHVMEGLQPQYLDERSGEMERAKFPVEDSYGVRLKFYTNPRPAGSLLGR